MTIAEIIDEVWSSLMTDPLMCMPQYDHWTPMVVRTFIDVPETRIRCEYCGSGCTGERCKSCGAPTSQQTSSDPLRGWSAS